MYNFIGDQGEIKILKIDKIPDVKYKEVKKSEKGFIISHSEKGHHHILSDGEVMERTEDVPEGMRIFYAIIEDTQTLFQDCGNPHEPHVLLPDIYEFRIKREYNPFTEQARQVAD